MRSSLQFAPAPGVEAQRAPFYVEHFRSGPRISAQLGANLVRAGRVLTSLALVAVFYVDTGWSRYVALAMVCAIWLSDIVDGRIHRRTHEHHRMAGVVFDPMADDIAFAIGFLCLLSVGLVPLWFVALVIGGRVLIALVRLVTLVEQLPFAAPSRANRIKGAGYAVGQILLFAGHAAGSHVAILADPMTSAVLVAAMTLLTVVALVDFLALRNRQAVGRLFRQ